MDRDAGIRQFLDIGTGIPTSPNLQEIAQSVAPESRVVYVDNDPIVLTLSQGLPASTPEGRTAYIDADFQHPEDILDSPDLRETLDLIEPGIVQVHKWHPDAANGEGIRDEDIAMYVAVARKP